MGIISWVVLGLIVGALAKWIMPGRDGGGFIITVLLGIGGALLGGFIASKLGFGHFSGFDLRSLGIATGGALIILYLHRVLVRRR